MAIEGVYDKDHERQSSTNLKGCQTQNSHISWFVYDSNFESPLSAKIASLYVEPRVPQAQIFRLTAGLYVCSPQRGRLNMKYILIQTMTLMHELVNKGCRE